MLVCAFLWALDFTSDKALCIQIDQSRTRLSLGVLPFYVLVTIFSVLVHPNREGDNSSSR